MDPELSDILSDRENGSTDILIRFIDYAINLDPINIRVSTSILQSTFKDMTVIDRFKSEINMIDDTQLHEFLKEYKSKLLQSYTIIHNKLYSMLKLYNFPNLLTISNSRTLRIVLQMLSQDLKFCLHIMYSNPGGEGEILFRNLEPYIDCIDLIDDNVDLSNIDCIITGCDGYNNRYFINKVGTAKLVKIAKLQKIPVFVLTTSSKFNEQLSVHSELLELVDAHTVLFITDD